MFEKSSLSAISLVLLPLTSQAADWSSTNVQLLRGHDYALGETHRSIMTLEHASGWGLGDNFFFIDITNPTGSHTSQYGEFSPRLSLSKTLGIKPTGWIKDYFLAATFEMGDNLNAQLFGVSAAFNVTGFDYLNANLYYRQSHRDWVSENTDAGGQVTVTWRYPFSIAASKWQFGGFIDYAFNETGGTSPKKDNLMAAPQLLVDIGQALGKGGSLLLGFEHQIWRNKFGVTGVDENVTQAMVKWIL